MFRLPDGDIFVLSYDHLRPGSLFLVLVPAPDGKLCLPLFSSKSAAAAFVGTLRKARFVASGPELLEFLGLDDDMLTGNIGPGRGNYQMTNSMLPDAGG
jgi:hypothetical protein